MARATPRPDANGRTQGGFGVVLAGISDKLKKLWRTYITRLTRTPLISR